VFKQQRDVFAPVPQGGQPDLHHLEPVVEVFPHFAQADFLLEISVGGRNQTNVHLGGGRAADPLEFALFENAQELHLDLGRDVANFIEEDGAAVRPVEPALVVPDGAGERPFDMAEEFRFQEIVRAVLNSSP
jgi:hypothetical protein